MTVSETAGSPPTDTRTADPAPPPARTADSPATNHSALVPHDRTLRILAPGALFLAIRGIGILMLAALSILGLTDIHQMNGLKNFFGGCINGVAAFYFIWSNMVYWPYVFIMALGAIAGGYLGAGAARRVGRTAVRRIVIGIGFSLALSLFLKFLVRP